MARLTLHLTITGRVQGVGYRQWFKREAGRRGVTGWVRNRMDETVEAVVTGAAEAVKDLVREAMNGPMGAKVESIERREEGEVPSGDDLVILPNL